MTPHLALMAMVLMMRIPIMMMRIQIMMMRTPIMMRTMMRAYRGI